MINRKEPRKQELLEGKSGLFYFYWLWPSVSESIVRNAIKQAINVPHGFLLFQLRKYSSLLQLSGCLSYCSYHSYFFPIITAILSLFAPINICFRLFVQSMYFSVFRQLPNKLSSMNTTTYTLKAVVYE